MLYFSKLDYILDYISILLNIFQILIIILTLPQPTCCRDLYEIGLSPLFIKFFFYTYLSLHYLIPFPLQIT